jgi:rod shape-determining protein MreD
VPRVFSGKVILLLLALLVLEISLTPLFRPAGIQPFLLYLMILYAAFEWDWERVIKMAIAVGLIRDMTISPLLGLETVTLAIAAFLLGLGVQKIDRGSTSMRIGISLLFVFFVSVINLILTGFLTAQNLISLNILSNSFSIAVSSAVVAPFFYALLGRWYGERVPLKQYELFR